MTKKMNVEPGALYDANYDPELVAERAACKELCYDFNATRPSMERERSELLGRLLGRMGRNCVIEPPFFCDYGYNIHVGEVPIHHQTIIFDPHILFIDVRDF